MVKSDHFNSLTRVHLVLDGNKIYVELLNWTAEMLKWNANQNAPEFDSGS